MYLVVRKFGDFDSPADSDVSDISCDATALSSLRSLPDAILILEEMRWHGRWALRLTWAQLFCSEH